MASADPDVLFGSGGCQCSNPYGRSFFTPTDSCDVGMSNGVMILVLVLGVCTIIINFGVIVRTFKVVRKGGGVKPAFFFIGNLAISDFAIGLYVVIGFCIDLGKYSQNWREKACPILLAFPVTACQETIITIVYIAIDKYIYICHGFFYRDIVRRRRVVAIIALSWVVSLFVGFLPAMGLNEEEYCSCSLPLYVNDTFAIVMFITAIVVPLTIITTLYSILLVLAIKMTHLRHANGSLPSSSSDGTTARVIRLSLMSKSSRSSKYTLTSKSSKSSISSSLVSTHDSKVYRPGRRREKGKGSVQVRAIADKSESSYSNPVSENEEKEDGASKPSLHRGDSRSVMFAEEGQILEDANPHITTASQRPNKEETQHVTAVAKEADEVKTVENSLEDREDDERSRSSGRSWNKKSYYRRVLNNTKDKVTFLKRCQAIKTVFLILAAFILTYVPFVIGMFVFKLQEEPDRVLLKALNNLLFCAVVVNSLLNPFIYAYGYKEFRVRTEKFKGICGMEKKIDT